MRVRLHDGRADPPDLRPLLAALDIQVIAADEDRPADVALWNLSSNSQAAESELSDLLVARDPARLPRIVLVPADQARLESRAYEAGVEAVLTRPLSPSLLLGALDLRSTTTSARPRREQLPLLALMAGGDERIAAAFAGFEERGEVVIVPARGPAEIGAAIRQFDFDVSIVAAPLGGPGAVLALVTRLRRAQPSTPFIVFDSRGDEAAALADLGEVRLVDGDLDRDRIERVWAEVAGLVDRRRSSRQLHGEIVAKQRELQRVNATLRNINRAFRDANLRLEREGHVKDELIGVVAHELKSPLAAMKGAIDVLAADKDRFAAEDLALLDLVERNTRRMIKLVDDILDLARIEAGRVSVERSPVPPGEIIDQALKTVALRAQRKGIRFEIDEGAEEIVSVDQDRTVQILINLLDNAVKFSPRDGTVKVFVRSSQGELHFVVADSGPGVPEAERQAVFERFHRRSRGEDPHSGGSGLGLTISRALAEIQGGRVTVAESASGGAQFVVTLPRALA